MGATRPPRRRITRGIVAVKRDGGVLSDGQLEGFVDGYTRGEIPDALAAAFLMACLLRGLDERETLALTRAMVESGDTIGFSGLGSPTVDKHSTGGGADRGAPPFAPPPPGVGVAVAE